MWEVGARQLTTREPCRVHASLEPAVDHEDVVGGLSVRACGARPLAGSGADMGGEYET